MLRKVLFAVALGTLLMPALAFAQFNQGDWSLRLSGAGSSDNDFESTALSGAAEIDYFLGDNFSVGLDQSVTFVDASDTSLSGATRAGADFYIDLDRWQPYIGAFVGYIYGDDVEETWIAGPEGGVAYFVNATTFIFVEVEYQFLFENTDDFSDNVDDGIWAYGMGIGFTW
jgi:hypothetical protein